MPNRLSKIVVDELSLVDNMAEPGAKVELFKRAKGELEIDLGEVEVDEMWAEEVAELGKAQPTSVELAGDGPMILISQHADDDEDEDEEFKSIYKQRAAPIAVVAEANIHRDFTTFADGLYGGGYLSREERIAMSSAIGDALKTFTAKVQENAPALLRRRQLDKRGRMFSTEVRSKLADEGAALEDGSFPIPDKDALRRAIMAYGRTRPEKRASVIAHIRRRAKALGAEDMVPDTFKKLEGWDEGQDDNPSSDGTQPADVSKTTEGKMPETKELDLSVLPDEVKEAVEDHVAEVTKRAEDAEAELAVLKAGDGEEDGEGDDILKNADPAIREIVEKANARASEAETIAKAERDARINREFIEKAKSLPFVPGEDQEKANVMKAASASMEPDEYQSLEKMLTSMNEVISESKVFTKAGSSQYNEDTPQGEIEKLAKARAKEEGITEAEAMDQVLAENPDLYERSLEEVE